MVEDKEKESMERLAELLVITSGDLAEVPKYINGPFQERIKERFKNESIKARY